MGLDGIDNGFMIFNNHRIPYDALLDRLSSIDIDGNFKSDISNVDQRFAVSLGGLSGGRLGVTFGANKALLQGMTIATRFALMRRQFGQPDKPETRLLDY